MEVIFDTRSDGEYPILVLKCNYFVHFVLRILLSKIVQLIK